MGRELGHNVVVERVAGERNFQHFHLLARPREHERSAQHLEAALEGGGQRREQEHFGPAHVIAQTVEQPTARRFQAARVLRMDAIAFA